MLVEIHDVAGVAEGIGSLGDVGRGNVKRERGVVVLVLDAFEITGDERHEVIGVGLVLRPMKSGQAGGILVAGKQAAIGKDGHAVGNVAGDFGGEFFVGSVGTRIPVAVVNGFALGEKMFVARQIAHFRGAEVEALFGLGAVTDGKTGFLAGGNGIGKIDDEAVFVDLPGLNLFAGIHGEDGHVGGVQFHFGLAGDGALLEIGRDVQAYMEETGVSVRGVLAGGRMGLAGAAMRGVNVIRHRDAGKTTNQGKQNRRNFHKINRTAGILPGDGTKWQSRPCSDLC